MGKGERGAGGEGGFSANRLLAEKSRPRKPAKLGNALSLCLLHGAKSNWGPFFLLLFLFFFLVGLLFIRIRIYYMDVAVLVCLLVCLFVRQPVCVRSKCGRTIFNYTF